MLTECSSGLVETVLLVSQSCCSTVSRDWKRLSCSTCHCIRFFFRSFLTLFLFLLSVSLKITRIIHQHMINSYSSSLSELSVCTKHSYTSFCFFFFIQYFNNISSIFFIILLLRTQQNILQFCTRSLQISFLQGNCQSHDLVIGMQNLDFGIFCSVPKFRSVQNTDGRRLTTRFRSDDPDLSRIRCKSDQT